MHNARQIHGAPHGDEHSDTLSKHSPPSCRAPAASVHRGRCVLEGDLYYILAKIRLHARVWTGVRACLERRVDRRVPIVALLAGEPPRELGAVVSVPGMAK